MQPRQTQLRARLGLVAKTISRGPLIGTRILRTLHQELLGIAEGYANDLERRDIMIRKSLIVIAASLLFGSTAFAQGGGGGGTGGGAAGGSASSAGGGMGTGAGTSAGAASSGPSAPSGMGTQGTTTGANRNTNTQLNNPNVQPPTANKTPAATQAERNAGVGHAANGQPIGSPGTGTSNEDQK